MFHRPMNNPVLFRTSERHRLKTARRPPSEACSRFASDDPPTFYENHEPATGSYAHPVESEHNLSLLHALFRWWTFQPQRFNGVQDCFILSYLKNACFPYGGYTVMNNMGRYQYSVEVRIQKKLVVAHVKTLSRHSHTYWRKSKTFVRITS